MKTSIINPIPYNPPLILRNSHINTIYPYFFRKTEIVYDQRVRYDTPDGDFFDVDFKRNNHSRIAVLLHGMEGSSHSQYTLALSSVLKNNDWDVAAINHRSCSGEINQLPGFYHSGFYHDLEYFIAQIEHQYESIAIIGYSLGGNITLHYLGRKEILKSPKIKVAVAVSVPLHLMSAGIELSKTKNKIYTINFLKTLTKKIQEKHTKHPQTIDIKGLNKIKSLREFDEAYTAPLHGFSSADDYYEKASSIKYMDNISLPTLIINALDDPFLSKECYPSAIVKENEYIQLLTPKYGGHVGFSDFKNNIYWSDKVIIEFLDLLTSDRT